MEVKEDFLTFNIGFAIISGLFLLLLILTVKKKCTLARELPNILLTLFLMACSISMSDAAMYHFNIYRHLPHLARVSEPVSFLLAPLFYFYTLSLTTGKLKWHPAMLFHFLPFAIDLILFIPFYFQSLDEKFRFITEKFASDQVLSKFNFLFWILLLIQLGYYTYQVKRKFKSYQTTIEANFGSLDKINLRWLNTFVNGTISICFYLAAFIILSLFIKIDIPYLRPIPLVVAFLLLFLVIKALRQPQLWDDPTILGDANPQKKYEKSSLSPEEAENYLQRLTRHMEVQKPYLEPEITLQQLSDQLQIPVRHLSNVINEKTGYNFYNYINFYRVETVKKDLSDRYQIDAPIFELARAAGFNSQAAFNAVFKQFTGLTPQQFRLEFCSKDNLHRLH